MTTQDQSVGFDDGHAHTLWSQLLQQGYQIYQLALGSRWRPKFAQSNPIVFCKNAMTVVAEHMSWLD